MEVDDGRRDGLASDADGGMKQFFRLTGLRRRSVVLMALNALLAGGINAAMLAVLAQAMNGANAGQASPLGWVFLGTVLAYVASHQLGARSMAKITEQCCAVVRERLLLAVFNARLIVTEATSHHIKRTLFTRDAAQLTSAIPTLVGLLGSAATALGAVAYLVWLSPAGAALVCVVIAIAVLAYQTLVRGTTRRMRHAYDATDVCFGFADDLFLGSKELKLDREFGKRFMRDDLLGSLRKATRLTAQVKAEQQDLGLVGVLAFYGLTGMVAFGAGSWLHMDPKAIMTVVLVLLYLQAHVHAIVQRLPSIGEALYAQRRILAALGPWESGAEKTSAAASPQSLDAHWNTLRLEGLGFSYDTGSSDQRFKLQDVNLQVKRGTTVFIVGGNGSGKTTLAKLLLGLYQPHQGRILLDDTAIDDGNRLTYRASFNAVLSDTHLFRRNLQGLAEDSMRKVTRILNDLAIRLRFTSDKRVDVAPFSQGQKRRLASAFVLANDKPLCLFDEWTADQDPEFRQYFYHAFLPRLRAEGKTLFVITHDDRYFNCADLVVRLDAGRITEVVDNRAVAASA